jgi:hypothetical protein
MRNLTLTQTCTSKRPGGIPYATGDILPYQSSEPCLSIPKGMRAGLIFVTGEE